MPQASANLFWFERKQDDFPYYQGRPVDISGPQWILVLTGVGVAFLVLAYTPLVLGDGVLSLLPALLFSGIQLCVLAFVSGSGWTALFRPFKAMDIVWILAFFVLNWIVTFIAGALAIELVDAQPNPAAGTAAAATGFGRVLFFARTGIQLLGEELLTILPFLAALWWLTARRGMGRKTAVLLAALIASILFALAHLPTYQWNLGHTLIGLVPVRIVLLLPYLVTKNILVSTAVHILYDWAIFVLPMLVATTA